MVIVGSGDTVFYQKKNGSARRLFFGSFFFQNGLVDKSEWTPVWTLLALSDYIDQGVHAGLKIKFSKKRGVHAGSRDYF